MLFLAEKGLVRVFENQLDFNTNGKHHHRHQERYKHTFLRRILGLESRDYLGDRDEQLLLVVFVQRQRVYMTENTPVCQMADLTNQFCCLFICYSLFCSCNFRFGQRRSSSNQGKHELFVLDHDLFLLNFLFLIVQFWGRLSLLVFR